MGPHRVRLTIVRRLHMCHFVFVFLTATVAATSFISTPTNGYGIKKAKSLKTGPPITLKSPALYIHIVELTCRPSGEGSVHYCPLHLDHNQLLSPNTSLYPDDLPCTRKPRKGTNLCTQLMYLCVFSFHWLKLVHTGSMCMYK